MWNNNSQQSYGYGQLPPTSQPMQYGRTPYIQSSMPPPALASNTQPPRSASSTNNPLQRSPPAPQALSLEKAQKKSAADKRIEEALAAARARRRLGQAGSQAGSTTVSQTGAPPKVVKHRPQQPLSTRTAAPPKPQPNLAILPGRRLEPAPTSTGGGPGPVSYPFSPDSAMNRSGKSRPKPFRRIGGPGPPAPLAARQYPTLAMAPPTPQPAPLFPQYPVPMSQGLPSMSNQTQPAFAHPAQVNYAQLEQQRRQSEQWAQQNPNQATEANFARMQNGGWFQ